MLCGLLSNPLDESQTSWYYVNIDIYELFKSRGAQAQEKGGTTNANHSI